MSIRQSPARRLQYPTEGRPMKRLILAGAAIAGLLNYGFTSPAHAGWDGKPILSGMKNENDPAVQHVRDALMAFSHINKGWPANIAELAAFAKDRSMPFELGSFETAKYYVAQQGNDQVAVFEFKMAGSPVKGSFALVIYIVK
jgi:hypothetical protein